MILRLTAKTGLLRTMSRQYKARCLVCDAIGGDGRVVRDLLDEEGGIGRGPGPVEYPVVTLIGVS